MEKSANERLGVSGQKALELIERLPPSDVVLPVHALGELFNVLVRKAKRAPQTPGLPNGLKRMEIAASRPPGKIMAKNDRSRQY